MHPTQRCFGIEREGDLPTRDRSCLANFKDEFVILVKNYGSLRYSLAEDKWEKLPSISIGKISNYACSLGDKVYVMCIRSVGSSNFI